MVGEPIRRWFEEIMGYKRGETLFCYDVDQAKNYSDDINRADIIFLAVPTSQNLDGSCDTSVVEGVLKTIPAGKTVVIKSTVVPGTTQKLQNKYKDKKIIFSPEFFTEAKAWSSFINPDRQIVGHTTLSSSDVDEIVSLLPKAEFTRPKTINNTEKNVNSTEAELAKYGVNVFGYMKVVYGNVLADICEAVSIKFNYEDVPLVVDYDKIREIISADKRIGEAWLDVGYDNYCGVGGRCFPKDMNAFVVFVKDLLKFLKEKEKEKKINKGLINALKRGIAILEAVVLYNRELLKWQGLSAKEVMKYDKEKIIRKRKPIRMIKRSNLSSL